MISVLILKLKYSNILYIKQISIQKQLKLIRNNKPWLCVYLAVGARVAMWAGALVGAVAVLARSAIKAWA